MMSFEVFLTTILRCLCVALYVPRGKLTNGALGPCWVLHVMFVFIFDFLEFVRLQTFEM